MNAIPVSKETLRKLAYLASDKWSATPGAKPVSLRTVIRSLVDAEYRKACPEVFDYDR